jgi:hypothetical protein
MLTLLETGVLAGTRGKASEAVSNEYFEDTVIGKDALGGERRQRVRFEGLYDQARRVSPKLKPVSDVMLGRYLSKFGTKHPDVPVFIKNRPFRDRRGWRFPPLAECRDKWCERFPDTVWPQGGPSEWGGDDDDEN